MSRWVWTAGGILAAWQVWNYMQSMQSMPSTNSTQQLETNVLTLDDLHKLTNDLLSKLGSEKRIFTTDRYIAKNCTWSEHFTENDIILNQLQFATLYFNDWNRLGQYVQYVSNATSRLSYYATQAMVYRNDAELPTNEAVPLKMPLRKGDFAITSFEVKRRNCSKLSTICHVMVPLKDMFSLTHKPSYFDASVYMEQLIYHVFTVLHTNGRFRTVFVPMLGMVVEDDLWNMYMLAGMLKGLNIFFQEHPDSTLKVVLNVHDEIDLENDNVAEWNVSLPPGITQISGEAI